MTFLLKRPGPLSAERQKVLLLTALLAVLVEITVLMGGLPYLNIGRSSMPVSVFVCAGVLGILGRRAFGRRTTPGHSEPFWIAATVGIGFGTVLLDRGHQLADAPGILIAAMGEEVIYRFAVPTLVAAILVSFKVTARPARIAGYAVGAVWFVLLPWHRAQMGDAAQVLPFVAFAALAGLVAYRSGSIAATGAVHTVMNMLTVLVYDGQLNRVTRSLAMACLLTLLVSTYGLVRTLARPAVAADGPLVDLTATGDGAVIDLRDGVAPSVTRADGTSSPVLDPTPVEADAPGR